MEDDYTDSEDDEYGFYQAIPRGGSPYCMYFQDASVFIDFDVVGDHLILRRISFDAYGCCELGEHIEQGKIIPLTKQESQVFKELYEMDEIPEEIMERIVMGTIKANKEFIWAEALWDHFSLHVDPSHISAKSTKKMPWENALV